MTHVLILRSAEDAERTAGKLRSLGVEPLFSPVIEIAGTGAIAPQGDYDAVLATSAKGLEHVPPQSAATLHVVGARTAEVATRLGWRPDLVAGAAKALLPQLGARYPKPARFLYLAGRDRQNDLEFGLRAMGHEVEIVETYEARAAERLSDEALAGLRTEAVAAVLHYSRRSVEIFLSLAQRAGLLAKLGGCAHLALSQDVASPLIKLGLRPLVADKPDEEHVLLLLSKILGWKGAR